VRAHRVWGAPVKQARQAQETLLLPVRSPRSLRARGGEEIEETKEEGAVHVIGRVDGRPN